MKHVDLPTAPSGGHPAPLPPLVSISEADAGLSLCVLSLRVSYADACRVSEALASMAGGIFALWEGSGASAETRHVEIARRLDHLAEMIRQAQAEFMRTDAREVTR